MGKDNATINLYINTEQAIASIDKLNKEYHALKDARKEADAAGDLQKTLDLQAQERVALTKLQEAKRGQLDIEKVLLNISKISTTQLLDVRRKLTKEISLLNRDTDEYIQKKQQLMLIEEEYSRATAKTTKSQSFLSKITPTIDLTSMFSAGIAAAKRFVGEMFEVTKQLQGDAKRAAQVFGDELGYVENQAEKLSKKMGVTNAKFVAMASSTADLLIPLGFTRKESAKMSTELQSLTGALDEWTSGKFGASEVSARLTKAVLGETESLKELGISIRLDSNEYKNLVKQKMEVTGTTDAQARALATLDLIYAKTTDAQTAYNSGGNETLRMQKNVTRGWRNMIEAIGDWFAFSADERLEKEVRQYKAMSEEMTVTESRLDSLIPKYEQLSTKTDLNATEQYELRAAIDEIAKIVPYAVTGFNDYGEALGINLKAVKNFSEGVRLMKLEMHKDVTDDIFESLAEKVFDIKERNFGEKRTLEQNLKISEGFLADPKLNTKANQLRYESDNNRLFEFNKEILLTEQSAGKLIETLKAFGYTYEDIVAGINDNNPNVIYWLDDATEADVVGMNNKFNATSGKNNSKSYDLSADENYNSQVLQLRDDLKNGLIESDEEYNNQVLALEVKLLSDQIAQAKAAKAQLAEAKSQQNEERFNEANVFTKNLARIEKKATVDQIAEKQYSDAEIAKMEEQLLDRQLKLNKVATAKKEKAIAAANARAQEAQRKQGEEQRKIQKENDRQEKLISAAAKNGGLFDSAKLDYDKQLKALGLYGKDVKDMTKTEKEALLSLETDYNRRLSSIQLSDANARLSAEQQRMSQRLTALKVAQAEELDAAQTLEEQKAILSRYMTSEELAQITTTSEAKAAILKKYDTEQTELTRSGLTEIVKTYQSAIEELSTNGSLFGEVSKLTEEDKAKLDAIIADLKLKLLSLKSDDEGEGDGKKASAKPDDKTDILGMTADDWQDLFENLDESGDKLGKVMSLAKAVGNAFSDINNLVTALAEKELADFETNQDRKKERLEENYASGIISEQYYQDQVQRIDKETDTKRQQLEKEAAEREKALAIFNALVNTAEGVTAALTIPPPMGITLAAIVGAMGAIQVAAIAAQPVPGAEQGGFVDVVRSQDGKRFRARPHADQRGYVDTPTVLVGENGREFVASHLAASNPTVKPVLDIINQAQIEGRIGSINLPREMMMRGYEVGGYISPTPVSPTGNPVSSYPGVVNDPRVVKLLESIAEKLDTPAPAFVTLDGRNGLAAQIEEYNKQKNKGKK